MCKTLGIIVVLFLAVTTLKADPVIITGGTLIYDQANGHPFTLTGDGTVINGSTASLSAVMGTTVLVAGGREITFLNLAVDTQDGEISATFPITVGGVTYNSGHIILLQLRSNAFPFIVPGPANGFILTAPLTMTGGVFGFNGPGFNNEFFSNTLLGQGTQVFTFRNCLACTTAGVTNVYMLESWVGTFGAVAPGVTVQTIPEPASIFLLATSAAALSWMNRRRKLKG